MTFTEQLETSILLLESITNETPKREIKEIASRVYSDTKAMNARELFGYPYPTAYLNVLESTYSISVMKWGIKNRMLIRVGYAKENLKEVIEITENIGL